LATVCGYSFLEVKPGIQGDEAMHGRTTDTDALVARSLHLASNADAPCSSGDRFGVSMRRGITVVSREFASLFQGFELMPREIRPAFRDTGASSRDIGVEPWDNGSMSRGFGSISRDDGAMSRGSAALPLDE